MEVGSRIGPYRVLRLLGEGGMGAVFEAVHETIERHVAIKVLHPRFSQDQELLTRFVNEARAVNRVQHPGIVQISDHGQLPDGSSYIVMEFLRGQSLRQRMTQQPLTLREVLRLGHLMADALAAAHQAGVLHRDLKPDNVMLVADAGVPGGERTKLVDFGIAKLQSPGADLRTKTNALMGTPTYMSPEQCRGAGTVDERSDVYSLGVMLYEMLAGAPPFSAAGLGDLLAKHMFEAPRPLAQAAPQLPRPVTELVDQLLVKEPQRRPTMAELVGRLQDLKEQVGEVSLAAARDQAAKRSTLSEAATQSWLITAPRRTLAVGVLSLLAMGAVVLLVMRVAPDRPRVTPWTAVRADARDAGVHTPLVPPEGAQPERAAATVPPEEAPPTTAPAAKGKGGKPARKMGAALFAPPRHREPASPARPTAPRTKPADETQLAVPPPAPVRKVRVIED